MRETDVNPFENGAAKDGAAKKNTPGRRRWRRVRNITILVLVAAFVVFFAIRFYFPFGEGVKTGQLNYVVRKGIVFKTYEGKLIQSGFRSRSGGLQSNEFEFSIADRAIADSLMRSGGQEVELRYTEYFGALPWRGHSRYVVKDIIGIKPAEQQLVLPPAGPASVPAE